MKNIIITGGAGFIGSNAVEHFIKNNGYKVTAVIDKITYAADIRRVEKYPNMRVYKFDVADANLGFMFEKEDPAIIIHFAAESHVDNSINAYTTHDFIKSNYSSVASLVQAIRVYRARTNKKIFLVHISTDEVLGDIPIESDDAYDEYRPLKPNNLYSATKAAAEQLIEGMHHTYDDFDYTIVRATNNYGPNQHFEKFIPTVISSVLNNKQIPLYGKGENIREWLWANDFVRGIEKVLQKYDKNSKDVCGEIFHFGSGYRITNLEVIKIILKIMGRSENMIKFVEDRLGHDRKYALNCDKAMSVLGWQPKIEFDVGIRTVITDIENRIGEQKNEH